MQTLFNILSTTVHYLKCMSKAIVQTTAGEPRFCGNTCPPFPSRKKIFCTDEYHKGKWHGVPVPLSHSMSSSASTSPAVSAFSVHVKQAVGIELHALGYLNPKVIVDNAVPVHINPALGKLVGV